MVCDPGKVLPPGPQRGVQLLDPKVTQQVVNWMETVVDKGTGKGIKIPGYRIGGKTGTAQKAENGVYIPGARITSFVAILPVENPRYVVLVVMDEPQEAMPMDPQWRCRWHARLWKPSSCSRRSHPHGPKRSTQNLSSCGASPETSPRLVWIPTSQAIAAGLGLVPPLA